MFGCFGKKNKKNDPMRGAMVYRQTADAQRQRAQFEGQHQQQAPVVQQQPIVAQMPPPGYQQSGPPVYDARGNVMGGGNIGFVRAQQLAAEATENTSERGAARLPR